MQFAISQLYGLVFFQLHLPLSPTAKILKITAARQSTESAQPILSDDEDEAKEPNCLLMEPDFQLMQALMASQQNFTISDPSMPDNPIVYASQASRKMGAFVLALHMGYCCAVHMDFSTNCGQTRL